MIDIIPAIDLIDGHCVRLTRGEFSSRKEYDASPVDMARMFEDCGVRRIHAVDLDGARLSSPKNLRTLEEIAGCTGVEIEWGGGISSAEALESVFSAGATQAIIGSVAARKPEMFSTWLRQFGGERILLGSDVKGGSVFIDGWLKSAGMSLSEQITGFMGDGLKYLIVTDISRDGLLEGPSFGLYREIMDNFPALVLTASGGISCMDDIRKLDGMSVPKVIVGKAIYEGRIVLKDIKEWQSQRG